jgi:hypothetical protein
LNLRPGLALLAGALTLAAGASGAVIEPDGRGCPEAAVTAALSAAQHDGGDLHLSGRFTAGGTAAGALVEYRVDSDRYRAETRAGKEGALESVFPFKLCGDHVARLAVYPLVADGDRQAICLARSAQAVARFNVSCGAELRFGDCRWQCDEASGACTGSCVATVRGEGDFKVVMSVAQAAFQPVGEAGPGPFHIALSCRAGESIRLRARSLRASRYGGFAEHVCGQP